MDPALAHDHEWPAVVDEGAVEQVGRQSEDVVAVEVSQEQRLDGAGVDAQPAHVREQGGAGVEQQAVIDHDGAVVALGREGGAGAEERELQRLTRR